MALCDVCWSPGSGDEEIPNNLNEESGSFAWNKADEIFGVHQSGYEEYLGRSVAISGDGSVGVISRTGGAKVISLSSSSITVDQVLSESGQLAMSGNGKTIAIGQKEFSSNAGRVLIFRKSGASWSQVHSIPCPANAGGFGQSLDLSYSGKRLVVLAPGIAPQTTSPSSIRQKAFVFEEDGSGAWNQVHSIAPAEPSYPGTTSISETLDNYRTQAVSITLEGDSIMYLVGNRSAVIANRSNGSWSDSQYVENVFPTTSSWQAAAVSAGSNRFLITQTSSGTYLSMWTKDSNGIWSRTNNQGLITVDGASGKGAGESVDVSRNGSHKIVGMQRGLMYPNPANSMAIMQFPYLSYSSGYGTRLDYESVSTALVGYSVAISLDGKRALIGSPGITETSAPYDSIGRVTYWKEVAVP